MGTETKTAKKRAPTLYFIAAIKLIKGIALVLLALKVFTLANRDLSSAVSALASRAWLWPGP